MAIEERGGGFRAQVMIDGKRHNNTFSTKQAAKDWIENQKRIQRRGDAVQMPSRDTLASVIDQYVEDDGDWSDNKTMHLNCLRRDLGHLPLAKLTSTAMIDYVYKLKTSRGNAASRMSYLKQALKHAKIVMGLTPRMDHFAEAREGLAEKKKIGASKARTRRPTDAEVERLVASHTNDPRAIDLPAILEILSILPIRVGELCAGSDLRHGIKWGDINHAKRTVTLRNRKHPDKNESADEVIPLLKVKKGGKLIDTYDLLVTNRKRFDNYDGPFPYEVHAISHLMKKTVGRAGVKDLHVHDFRAHAISSMLEAGIEPMMVMVISGHKNTAVFFKHYVRLDIEKVREDMERKLAA